MLILPLAVLIFFSFRQTSSAFLKGTSHPGQTILPACPPGEFPCNGTDTCVEQRKNCDGKEDCENGSDEWFCEDANRKEYWNNMFRKRPDEDREKQNEGCELWNASPEKCSCSGLKLFCDHRNFTQPPEKLPKNIEELDLSGNRLDILYDYHFQFNDHLHTLILTSSNVKIISKDAFKNLPKLKHLYLTANHINAIMDGTFATNSFLTFLILSHNPISALSVGAFKGLHNLEELDLRDCSLESLPDGVFDSLVNLKILWLDGNRISGLPDSIFRNLNNLHILSLSRNELKVSRDVTWSGMLKLRSLSLSQNFLTRLTSDSFGNMTSLLKLDLHANRIRVIERDAFANLLKLESLNLKMNQLKKPNEPLFDSLTSLNYIYFDDFHLCSLALKVRVCEPRGDGISSIAHLLDSVVLRVSVWLVAAIAVTGNAAVLVGRFLFAEPNEVHSFYIKNLSLADLLMAVYLFVIAAHDLAFRGEYILHETRWRQSWQCNFCGFLSTLSSEAAVLILTVITTDRYMSIIYPLSVKKRTVPSAAAAMAIAWAIAILLSALPMLNISYYGDEFYGNNGVCLPLHIHDPFGKAWEYSTFLFCGVNLAAFLFILFAYILMFFTISHSKIGLRCTQQQQDRNIAKRFAFIVGTDFLCWVPIVFIKVIAMCGVPIQEDLYAWVAVFLLPVNSAINPILYTLTTKLFKQHLAKMVYNFKTNSLPGSGDSVTPSCARNHSLRVNRQSSLSRGEPNHISLVMSRSCPQCRLTSFARKKDSVEMICPHGRRLSGKRKSSTNIM